MNTFDKIVGLSAFALMVLAFSLTATVARAQEEEDTAPLDGVIADITGFHHQVLRKGVIDIEIPLLHVRYVIIHVDSA